MAERRMFAKAIIDSDNFINMPFSAQALYFHFAMQADDDGFINKPNRIKRMINASDEDEELLISNNFILPFESGIIVIKHWKIHNYIRNDRYKDTIHQTERALLEIGENREYYLLNDECMQNGKEDAPPKKNAHAREEKTPYGEYQNVLLSDEEYDQLKSKYSDYDKRIERLSAYIKISGKNYDSHYATIIMWAEEDADNGANNSYNELDDFEKSQLKKRMEQEPEKIGDIFSDMIRGLNL